MRKGKLISNMMGLYKSQVKWLVGLYNSILLDHIKITVEDIC